MQLVLNKPELERYIAEQVASGRFLSAEAAVEAAVEQMRVDDAFEITDEIADSLNEAEDSIDRGEGIPFEDVVKEFREKYGVR